jgi:hypothetical protein
MHDNAPGRGAAAAASANGVIRVAGALFHIRILRRLERGKAAKAAAPPYGPKGHKVEDAQVRLSTSLAFAATARLVLVGKPNPLKIDPKRTVELGEFGGRGLVRAAGSIAVGERVFEMDLTALRLPVGEPRIVAGIDTETRAGFGECLIAWAGVPHPPAGDTAPTVTLDPERFEYVLLGWAYQQTLCGKTTADLTDFAPGDVPLGCAITLSEHLQADGLMRMSPRPGSAVISLTAEGIAAAGRAASERGDRRRRAEELRNGIIRWLWERDDGDASADFRDFIWDRRCTFRGHFFDLNVCREALYLVAKGLLYERNPWWLAPRLTAAGRDCAAYKGGNVHDQLNPPEAFGPTVNFNGNNSGNVAVGNEVTQTANSGIAPTGAEGTTPTGTTPAAVTMSHETEAAKNLSFWAKLRAFATGMSGVITVAAAIVIAVFTVLMWLIMSR